MEVNYLVIGYCTDLQRSLYEKKSLIVDHLWNETVCNKLQNICMSYCRAEVGIQGSFKHTSSILQCCLSHSLACGCLRWGRCQMWTALRQQGKQQSSPIALQQWHRDTEDSDSFLWKKKKKLQHRSVWPCHSAQHHSMLSFQSDTHNTQCNKVILLGAKKGEIKLLLLTEETMMSRKVHKRNSGICSMGKIQKQKPNKKTTVRMRYC